LATLEKKLSLPILNRSEKIRLGFDEQTEESIHLKKKISIPSSRKREMFESKLSNQELRKKNCKFNT